MAPIFHLFYWIEDLLFEFTLPGLWLQPVKGPLSTELRCVSMQDSSSQAPSAQKTQGLSLTGSLDR